MEYRVDISQTNRQAFRYIVGPVLLAAVAGFALNFPRWDFSFWDQSGFWPWMLSYGKWTLLTVGALAGGIFLHEGIHGLFIALFSPRGFRGLAFGFDRPSLSPYAHSREPLRAWQMTVVCLAPLVILGIFPFAAALWAGCIWAYGLSVFFIAAAGGDVIYARLLAKVPAKTRVKDLPDAVGFSVV